MPILQLPNNFLALWITAPIFQPQSFSNSSIKLSFQLLAATHVFFNYHPLDNIAVNCSSSDNSTGVDGRHWIKDIGSNYTPLLHGNTGKLISSKAINQPLSLVQSSLTWLGCHVGHLHCILTSKSPLAKSLSAFISI